MVTRGIRRAAALAVAAMPVSVWAGGGDAPASVRRPPVQFPRGGACFLFRLPMS